MAVTVQRLRRSRAKVICGIPDVIQLRCLPRKNASFSRVGQWALYRVAGAQEVRHETNQTKRHGVNGSDGYDPVGGFGRLLPRLCRCGSRARVGWPIVYLWRKRPRSSPPSVSRRGRPPSRGPRKRQRKGIDGSARRRRGTCALGRRGTCAFGWRGTCAFGWRGRRAFGRRS